MSTVRVTAIAAAAEVRKQSDPVITFPSESRIRGRKNRQVLQSRSANRWDVVSGGRGERKIIRIANCNEGGVGGKRKGSLER